MVQILTGSVPHAAATILSDAAPIQPCHWLWDSSALPAGGEKGQPSDSQRRHSQAEIRRETGGAGWASLEAFATQKMSFLAQKTSKHPLPPPAQRWAPPQEMHSLSKVGKASK